MKVLTFTSRNDGAGKTTLAASIAVAAMQAGETVLAIDMDDQRSLASWGMRRLEAIISVIECEPDRLHETIADARRFKSATLVIVDTPGVYDASVSTALDESDLCILPVRPSLLDVEASRPIIARLTRLETPFAFVINQVNPTAPARALDAATALVKTGALAPAMISNRTDFLDAMISGSGVTETVQRGKAAEEIRQLWTWIETRLGRDPTRNRARFPGYDTLPAMLGSDLTGETDWMSRSA